MEELVEKTSRLFGATRLALVLCEGNGQQVVYTWGGLEAQNKHSSVLIKRGGIIVLSIAFGLNL